MIEAYLAGISPYNVVTFHYQPEMYTVKVITEGEKGTVSVSSFQVKYGTVLSTSDDTLTVGDYGTSVATAAAADAQYTYAFIGWEDGDVTITSDWTVIAKFAPTVNCYTVYFEAVGEKGTVSTAMIANVPYGTALSAADNVFTVDGMGTCTATAAAADAQFTYAFVKWQSFPSTVTGDTYIVAEFAPTTNVYTVYFEAVGEKGTVSVEKIENVPYGTALSASDKVFTVAGKGTCVATPAAADAQYTYKFVQWQAFPDTVTGDTYIVAEFAPDTNLYTVYFKTTGQKGTVSVDKITDVPYGTALSDAATTFRVGALGTCTATAADPDAQYTYGFVQWQEYPATVTSDVTVIAEFAPVTNQYRVNVIAQPQGYGTVDVPYFLVDYGTKLTTSSNVLTVGSYGTSTGTPTPADIYYTYYFVNWTLPATTVTEDITVIANFDRTAVKYAVNVIFTCDGEEIVDGVSSAQYYGSEYTYNYLDYPYAPECFVGYTLISAEEYTITVQANPTGDKIVNTIEFQFSHVTREVMLWLEGDPGYNLKFTVNYGDNFNQVIQAYGDNVGKKMGISINDESGPYSYAPYNANGLKMTVINEANTQVVYGPITEDVVLYYNYV